MRQVRAQFAMVQGWSGVALLEFHTGAQTPLPQKEFTNYYHVSHNLPQIAQQLACKSRLARWRIATSCSVKGGGHHSPSWSSSKPVLQQNGFMWFQGLYVGFLFGGQVKKVQFESES